MATFTIKLSDLMQSGFEFGLTEADYPIFDETYRDGLNSKILKHYWNYEIGQETESMFRFSLNRKMNEIMPYYNQLYRSTQIEFDPLQTMSYTDVLTSTQTSEGTGTTGTDTTGKSRAVSSVTPQVQLSGNEDYAANAADTNSESNVTGNASHNDSTSGTIDKTVTGSNGIASELLMRYRMSFLNIDMQVIRELETLFMQIWDNGDEFSNEPTVMIRGFGNVLGIL